MIGGYLSREFGGAGSDEGGEGIDVRVDDGGLRNIGRVVESQNVDDSGGSMNDGDNDANEVRISKVARALLSIRNELQNKEKATGGKEGVMLTIGFSGTNAVLGVLDESTGGNREGLLRLRQAPEHWSKVDREREVRRHLCWRSLHGSVVRVPRLEKVGELDA